MQITTPSGRKLTLPPENRVRFSEFGAVPRGDPRLVSVPSSGPPQLLHWITAQQLAKMSEAAEADGVGPILIASGWRIKPWATRADYNAAMIKQYGSVAAARGKRAYESGHQSGLVIDIGSGGLEPRTATHKTQQDTPLYAWLVKNAARFGFTPYQAEAWHWELRIPLDLYESAPGSVSLDGVFGAGIWKKVAVVATTVATIAGAAWLIWRRR